jgi:hypothetical protein
MPTDEKCQPCQVPLTESLRRVPKQARIFIEASSGCGTTSLPVGEFCQQAADEIESLRINFSQQQLEIGRLITRCNQYAFDEQGRRSAVCGVNPLKEIPYTVKDCLRDALKQPRTMGPVSAGTVVLSSKGTEVRASRGLLVRDQVYRAIDSERDYQDSLGRDRMEDWERKHTTGEELSLISTYLRRAQDAYADKPGDIAALEVVRKIAGMCVRCMENHGAPFRQPIKGVVCSPRPESDLNDPRCRGDKAGTRADRPS